MTDQRFALFMRLRTEIRALLPVGTPQYVYEDILDATMSIIPDGAGDMLISAIVVFNVNYILSLLDVA